jgi:hypothetical protein
MSTVGTTSVTGGNLAALIANASSSSPSDPAPSGTPSTTPGNNRGPATHVQLSDEVKAILTKAKADQSAADRLQSFVLAQRTGNTESSQANARPKTDIDKAFQRLSGGGAQTADDPQAFTPVEPAINFSDHEQIGGFFVSVTADAETGAYKTEINGPDGLSFSDQRFGQNGQVTGFTGIRPDITASSYQTGNVEYVTFTKNDAAAASATASSGSDSVATSATATHVSSVTFAIDFTTGKIQTTEADASTASASAQVSQKTSPVSILA